MMKYTIASSLLALALLSGASQAADECCLCNDCDMMMKPGAQVYDLDLDQDIECSEFAELIFANVDGSHEICHEIQETFQSRCCLNHSPDSDHRSLHTDDGVTIPFSRRELWGKTVTVNFGGGNTWGYNGFGATQSFPKPSPRTWPAPAPAPTPAWGNNNKGKNNKGSVQQITQTQNTNGNALGCTVPVSNNYKTVQVYTPSSNGFTRPIGVNCATASRNGVPVSGAMRNVALKCVRCNCCGRCTGLDANVCVGNNQPRTSGSNSGWVARKGWRRFLESLGLDE